MDATAMATLGLLGTNTVALIFGLVKWSFGRNLKNEDEAREKLEKRQDETDKALGEFRAQLQKVEGQLSNLANVLPELKGTLQEMARSFETTREKQAQFYRDELEKLEQLLRQDITRVATPELSQRVTHLETRLSVTEGLLSGLKATPERSRGRRG